MNNNLIIIKKTNLDPILELYRGKTYCNIINYFIYIVTKNLGKYIFNLKKSYQRTLTNILSSWMFNLYISTSSDITCDPFLPKNCSNIDILKITLLDFCKNDNNIKDVELIINNLLDEFINYYNLQYDNLINYSKSIFYINEKNNYKIIKKKIIQKRDNQNINFYKFTIIINFGITNEKLENILNNILVPIDVYVKMCANYNGNIKFIDHYIWSIVFRYQLLGSNNHQLGILPSIINNMISDYNINFECFASAINFTLPNYCSIYYDLEQYFGSKGNFFNNKFIEGAYTFNPPYQKNIIENGVQKLLYHLKESDNTNNKLTFILTIPIWDKEGQKEINYENKIDYGDFTIINIIKKSEYFKGIRIITKENFTYIDHNFHLYKNKTIQNTYVIALSNTNIDFTKILNYNFYQ
jgi:hypothetical protein